MPRLHPHIKAVMEEMEEDDPARVVRAKARALVQQFVSLVPGDPPLNLEALASFRGLVPSQEAPNHSPDSEIAPENGRAVLRVNRDRRMARQRFSIGHEIGHTLFPEYQLAVRCRKPAHKDWADPDDHLEAPCDVAASEFLSPIISETGESLPRELDLQLTVADPEVIAELCVSDLEVVGLGDEVNEPGQLHRVGREHGPLIDRALGERGRTGHKGHYDPGQVSPFEWVVLLKGVVPQE